VTGGTINNNPNSNTTSYYFLYNWNYTPSEPPCISERVEHEITVNPTPAAPAAQTFNVCGSGTIADMDTDADVLWYDSADSDIPLAEATVLTDATYYLSRFLDDCESGRTAVEVNINAIPAAPAENAYTVCGGGTIAQLIPDEAIRLWYSAPDAEDPLEEETALAGTTY